METSGWSVGSSGTSDHDGGRAITLGLSDGDKETGFHVGDGMLCKGTGSDLIHMFRDVNLFLKICNK